MIACHLPIGIGHDDDYLIDLIYFYGSNMEDVMSVLPGRTMSTADVFVEPPPEFENWDDQNRTPDYTIYERDASIDSPPQGLLTICRF